MLSLYDILVNPISTEKYPSEPVDGKYAFKVHAKANKRIVKVAVEKIFGKKVLSVNIENVKGKKKTFRNSTGLRVGYKRAIVRLAPGQSIDFIA